MNRTPTLRGFASGTCVLCEGPLSPFDTPVARASPGEATTTYALCARPSCHTYFDHGRTLPAPLFRSHLEAFQRMNAAFAAQRRRERERDAASQREAGAAFARLRASGRGAAPGELELVVPSGLRKTGRLPARRRRAYAAHLDDLIDKVFGAPPESAPASPPPPHAAEASPLPARLCGECGGGCCSAGGDRAYLSEATLRRVRAAHPAMDAREIRAAYLDRLSPRTVLGSCINQTRQGCSLPRELRSDVCNSFVCFSLGSLQARLAAGEAVTRAVVLRRRQTLWTQNAPWLDNGFVAGAILTPGGTTRFPPPAPEPAPASDDASAGAAAVGT